MRTENLIRAIAADATPARPLDQRLSLAVILGWGVAAALLLSLLGVRENAIVSLQSPRFVFKFIVTLALAVTAGRLVLQLSRPGAKVHPWLIALAPALLAAAVLLELFVVPQGQWLSTMFGKTWNVCLIAIPALSLPILAAILLALRAGAPSSPAAVGAVAGLLAGGLGAALYAAHCPGDSPLFLGAWYTIAIAELALAGSIIGARVLRW